MFVYLFVLLCCSAAVEGCTLPNGQYVGLTEQRAGYLCEECSYSGQLVNGECFCIRSDLNPALACTSSRHSKETQLFNYSIANATCSCHMDENLGFWKLTDPPQTSTVPFFVDNALVAWPYKFSMPGPPTCAECFSTLYGPKPGTVTVSLLNTSSVGACNTLGSPNPDSESTAYQYEMYFTLGPERVDLASVGLRRGLRAGTANPITYIAQTGTPGASLLPYSIATSDWVLCSGHGNWNSTLKACVCNEGWSLFPIGYDALTGDLVYSCIVCIGPWGPSLWDKFNRDGERFYPLNQTFNASQYALCSTPWTPDPAPNSNSRGALLPCSGHGEFNNGECHCFKNATHGYWALAEYTLRETGYLASGGGVYVKDTADYEVQTCMECATNYSMSSSCMDATPSPTDMPTTSPTKQPTTSPTKQPTKEPTTSPTTSPSKEPTTSPTKQPTASPTTSPSKEPTTSPTSSPTKKPTTRSPTQAPTQAPTPPTSSPTPPTSSPTEGPTRSTRIVLYELSPGVFVNGNFVAGFGSVAAVDAACVTRANTVFSNQCDIAFGFFSRIGSNLKDMSTVYSFSTSYPVYAPGGILLKSTWSGLWDSSGILSTFFASGVVSTTTSYWSGTAAAGTTSGHSCQSWTVTSGYGRRGNSLATSFQWIDGGSPFCSDTYSIVCACVGPVAPLPTQSPTTRSPTPPTSSPTTRSPTLPTSSPTPPTSSPTTAAPTPPTSSPTTSSPTPPTQSPTPAIASLIIFKGPSSNADIEVGTACGQRVQTTAACATARSSNYPELTCINTPMIVSYDNCVVGPGDDDPVSGFPTKFNFATSTQVRGPTGIYIGTWANLMSGSLSSTIANAVPSSPTLTTYKTGTGSTGAAYYTCYDWTRTDCTYEIGSATSTTGTWLQSGSEIAGTTVSDSLCLCLSPVIYTYSPTSPTSSPTPPTSSPTPPTQSPTLEPVIILYSDLTGYTGNMGPTPRRNAYCGNTPSASPGTSLPSVIPTQPPQCIAGTQRMLVATASPVSPTYPANPRSWYPTTTKVYGRSKATGYLSKVQDSWPEMFVPARGIAGCPASGTFSQTTYSSMYIALQYAVGAAGLSPRGPWTGFDYDGTYCAVGNCADWSSGTTGTGICGWANNQLGMSYWRTGGSNCACNTANYNMCLCEALAESVTVAPATPPANSVTFFGGPWLNLQGMNDRALGDYYCKRAGIESYNMQCDRIKAFAGFNSAEDPEYWVSLYGLDGTSTVNGFKDGAFVTTTGLWTTIVPPTPSPYNSGKVLFSGSNTWITLGLYGAAETYAGYVLQTALDHNGRALTAMTGATTPPVTAPYTACSNWAVFANTNDQATSGSATYGSQASSIMAAMTNGPTTFTPCGYGNQGRTACACINTPSLSPTPTPSPTPATRKITLFVPASVAGPGNLLFDTSIMCGLVATSRGMSCDYTPIVTCDSAQGLANWPTAYGFDASTPVYTAIDDVLIASSWTNFWGGSWSNTLASSSTWFPYGSTPTFWWTGCATSNGLYTATTCINWSSANAGQSGTYGLITSTTTTAIQSSTQACSISARRVCACISPSA